MTDATTRIPARTRHGHSARPFFGAAGHEVQPFFAAAHPIQRQCATCAAEDGHRLQTLQVGAPDDRFEREADRVADRVVGAHGGAPGLAAAPQIHGAPASAVLGGSIRRQEELEWGQEGPAAALQRQPAAGAGHTADATAQAADAVASGGRPLSRSERSFFEPRFGRDFSSVRVHESARAGSAAEAINARAYTLGSDVAFAPGQYAADSQAGKRLLAHELTHVLQQSPGRAQVIARQERGEESTVRIGGLGGTESGTVFLELPIEFSAEPDLQLLVPPGAAGVHTPSETGVPGYPLSSTGLGLHVLASGDLSWLSRSGGAGRVLSPQYWSPFVPGRGYTTLDRLTNTLPRNLAPRIADELASGQPLTWVVQRGFTDAELRSIPDLVHRLNTSGVDSLTQAELAMLRRAAALHIGGSSVGAPFASYTAPNYTPPFLSGNPPRFRVRVEIPSTAALDVSAPNAFNLGREALTNIEEAEFLVVANREGRIVSVERISGEGRPGFAMRHAGKIRWGGRILFVAGLGVSAYRIAEATPEERPIVAAEEAGGHIGGFAGTALAVSGCVFFGIATGGVGLFVCGLVGGIAGGVIGSELTGSAARSLRGGELGGGAICPSCHALQRGWERERSRVGFEGFDFNPSLLPADAVPLSPIPNDPGTAPLTPEHVEAIRHWIETAQSERGQP